MVDMSKPVTIFVNGIKKITRKPVYNKTIILANFKADFDRKALWVDCVSVDL